MLVEVVFVMLGLSLLIGGGEVMIRGATGLATGLGVSPLAIGLTVVAFGTSAPELAVNLIAAFDGRSEISFGNIFGSNMANIGLIVGCTAIMKPILITGVVIAREIPMMLLATAAAIVMAFDRVLGTTPDQIGRADGIMLLLLFLVFLYYTIGDFVRQRAGKHANGAIDDTLGVGGGVARHLALTAIGLVALVWGADVTVDAATEVARNFGVPEVIIGLTILAVGTSLPELVASVTATMRGHAELAIGNVIGSNIFNLLWVLGVSALIRPLPFELVSNTDILMVIAASALLLLATASGKRYWIDRGEGGVFVIAYGLYVAFLIQRG